MTDKRQSAFMRPGKLILLMLLAAIVYLATLVVWVPAGWVWAQARSHINLPPQVQIQQVSGTLWSGAAGGTFAGKAFRLDWELGWPAAFKLPIDIEVRSAQSGLQGKMHVAWPLSLELNARGNVHVAEFGDLIRQSGGAILDGDVSVDRLLIQWADNRLQAAQGIARWPGGGVSWPVGDRRQAAEFPPMELILQNEAGGLSLKIAQQGQQASAADAMILTSGMLELRVYKRLIDLAGQPWSGAASPDDVVFRVRQPLLPGGRF